MKKTWIPLVLILTLGGIGLGYTLLSGPGAEVPDLSASSGTDTASALRGTYSWRSGGRAVHADSDHPMNFTYEERNILEADPGESVILTPMAGGKPAGSGFTLDSLEVFDSQGTLAQGLDADAEVSEGSISFNVPAQPGSYTAVLVLTFGRGTVSYGLRLRTGQEIPMKGLELYLWKDAEDGGKTRFTLLLGTNRNKEEDEVRDSDQAEDQVEEIRTKISGYPEGTEIFVYRADDFTETEFRSLIDALTKNLPQTFHDVGEWRR